MGTLGLTAIAVAVLSLTAPTAEAQQSDAQDEEARALYQAGRVAFDDGRFDDALEYFERSHELSGRPQLLYNIGSAADRLRRNAMALEHFEAYLEALPDAENRRSVEARIRLLQDALDHGREHGTVQDPDEGTEVPTPRETAEAGMDGSDGTGSSDVPPPSRTGLWVGIGVGAAVLVGLAVVLAVVLHHPSPDYQPSDDGVLVFTLESTP
jgi:tetratricopeptide (TPR) repeat protein